MTFAEWIAALIGGSVVVGAGAYLLGGMKAGIVSGSKCSADAFRAAVVKAARSQLGTRDLDLYSASAAPQFVGSKPEWCGIFALWALHTAGIAREIKWKTGLGFAYRLPRTNDPKPGDIAYYDQPWQHHAVVEAVRGDVIDVLNGNGAGNVVTATSPERSKATAYYSIQPWVDAAVADCEAKS